MHAYACAAAGDESSPSHPAHGHAHKVSLTQADRQTGNHHLAIMLLGSLCVIMCDSSCAGTSVLYISMVCLPHTVVALWFCSQQLEALHQTFQMPYVL